MLLAYQEEQKESKKLTEKIEDSLQSTNLLIEEVKAPSESDASKFEMEIMEIESNASIRQQKKIHSRYERLSGEVFMRLIP